MSELIDLSGGIRLTELSDKYYYTFGYKNTEEKGVDFLRLQLTCETLEKLATGQVQGMIQMGKKLAEIRDNRLYRSCSVLLNGVEMGFGRFEEFCEHVLRLSKTKAQNAISLYEMYSVGEEGIQIKPEYAGYSISQLIEMASIPTERHAEISQESTIKEIRKLKKELKAPTPSPDVLDGQMEIEIPTSEFSSGEWTSPEASPEPEEEELHYPEQEEGATEEVEKIPTSEFIPFQKSEKLTDEDISHDLARFEFIGCRIPTAKNRTLRDVAAKMGVDYQVIMSFAVQKYIKCFLSDNDEKVYEYLFNTELKPFIESEDCPMQYKKEVQVL